MKRKVDLIGTGGGGRAPNAKGGGGSGGGIGLTMSVIGPRRELGAADAGIGGSGVAGGGNGAVERRDLKEADDELVVEPKLADVSFVAVVANVATDSRRDDTEASLPAGVEPAVSAGKHDRDELIIATGRVEPTCALRADKSFNDVEDARIPCMLLPLSSRSRNATVARLLILNSRGAAAFAFSAAAAKGCKLDGTSTFSDLSSPKLSFTFSQLEMCPRASSSSTSSE